MGTNLPATTLPPINSWTLQYMNEEARLYGFDLSAKTPLAKTAYGDFSVAGMLSYANGKDLSLNTGLYNIMPINGKLPLIQKLGGWQGTAEFVGVDAKTTCPRTQRDEDAGLRLCSTCAAPMCGETSTSTSASKTC